jgi:pSer/pThr/pTyr-binding forkhead associated (FHA) protein
MRLIVKQKGQTVNEFRFTKGPIYIGRHANSQVLLADRAVSRQHAVIFTSQDGTWMLEDLDSANKTYLNEDAIHKNQIKTGDLIRISNFAIEVNLEDDGIEGIDDDIEQEEPINLADTLVTSTRDMQVIVRKPGTVHAPAMRLPAKRTGDFVQATEAVCKADGIEKVLLVLLHIARKQFTSYHAWCALRSEPGGPMTCHAGKCRDGQSVQLSDIKLNEKITEAIEKGQYYLIPKVPKQGNGNKVSSALVAPIISETGCFGVLYIDNALDHERYQPSDLDYLMLLTIHTASILENF